MDDLHIHAGGSYPLEVLKRVAEKNGFMQLFEGLVKNIEILKAKTLDTVGTYKLIKTQFSIISQIMCHIEDIRYGTAKLVEQHPSHYLELRTSLKKLEGSTLLQYAEAFAEGIEEANIQAGRVKAMGLLSIDRTRHSPEEAREIIKIALQLRAENKPIAGIDISGLPGIARSIKPKDLIEIIRLCLENGLPLTIHLGEGDDAFEEEDTNAVLDFLETEFDNNANKDPKYFRGIIRLGHVIHTTEAQRNKIRKMKLAIEVCPGCHEYLGWWDGGEQHPIHLIYPQDGEMIVCYGSDDPTAIYIEDLRQDMERLRRLVPFDPTPEDRFDWGVDLDNDLERLTVVELEQFASLQMYPQDRGYDFTSLSPRLLTLMFGWNLIMK